MPKCWKGWDKKKKRSFVFTVQTTASPEIFALPLEASGTYDFHVNWGDSNSDNITVWNDAATTHSYAAAGTYTITIFGIIQGWRFNNGGDKDKIYDISSWGPLKLGNSNGYFYGCSNLTISATDILDTAAVTTFQSAFRDCSSLTTLDVSGWDTAAITTFIAAFYNCSSLTTLDVSGWDTAAVATFQSAFYNCSSLTTLDVSGWDTAAVATFYSTFHNCSSLTTLDVSGWDTAAVANLYFTFRNCSSLTDPAINNWDITSVTDATKFMSGAKALSTAVYDATLIAWEAQAEQPNVVIHFDASKYTAGGAAAAARAALVANGWTITDGGVA